MQMRCVATLACLGWKLGEAVVSTGSAVTDCAVAPEIASNIIDTNVIAFIVFSSIGDTHDECPPNRWIAIHRQNTTRTFWNTVAALRNQAKYVREPLGNAAATGLLAQ